jgi:hypothetical protein
MNLKQTLRTRTSETCITASVTLRRVRTNIVKDEKGDLVADSHSILIRYRNRFSHVLNVHEVNDVRQT